MLWQGKEQVAGGLCVKHRAVFDAEIKQGKAFTERGNGARGDSRQGKDAGAFWQGRAGYCRVVLKSVQLGWVFDQNALFLRTGAAPGL